MSLPLPRRFAQAALLLGAAAAPLIGAGAAHAADLPQQALGGLTHLDGAGLTTTVDGASRHATGLADRTGTEAVSAALPTAGHLVGTRGTTVARQATFQAADTTGRLLGSAAESADGAVPAAKALPAKTLPATDALPTPGLPTDQLPLQGLSLL
jgi:hypothetical protein